MGLKYLWDTNIVIYYLQGAFPTVSSDFIDRILQEQQPILSFITEIELLSWKAVNENDDALIKKFVNHSIVFDAEDTIKRRAAEIRKTHGTKLPDAIIAATALSYDLTLLTRNTKDFNKIEGLKIFDVWSMENA